MATPRARPQSRLAVHILLFGVAYLGCAELGYLLASLCDYSIFWPASGLSLVVLARNGRRRRMGLALAILLASTLSELLIHQRPFLVGLGYATANLIEPLLGVWLLERFVGPGLRLGGLPEVAALIILPATLSTALGAAVGALATSAIAPMGSGPSIAWASWWVADGLGILVVAPLAVSLWEMAGPKQSKGLAQWNWRWLAEIVLALVALGLVSDWVFRLQNRPLTSASLPILLWLALRFDLRGVALGNAILAVVALWNTALGRGPFSSIVETPERILLVQAFLAVATVSLLVLAVVVRERRLAQAAAERSNRLFTSFMNNSPAVAFMKDAEGRMVYVNEPFERQFQKSKDQILGKLDHELWPPEVAEELRANDLAILASGQAVHLTEAVPTSDGSTHSWQVFKFPLRDDDSRTLLGGMAVDVTAERLAVTALQASEGRFRDLIERLSEGILLVDIRTGQIEQANQALLDMIGYTAEEIRALPPQDLIQTGDGDPPSIAVMLPTTIEQIRHDGRCDLGRRQFRHKNGSIVDVEVSVGSASVNEPNLLSFVAHDVTERIQHERELADYRRQLEAANSQLATLVVTDELTGLNNRRAFQSKLQEEILRSLRYSQPLSLILIDVDHFKLYNDTFGHPAGDEVLQHLSRLFEENGRSHDFIARLGGEEFAIILPNTDESGAMVLAERFRLAIAREAWPRRNVTISIGVSTLGNHETDPAELLQKADLALYHSKNHGRNRCCHAVSLNHPSA